MKIAIDCRFIGKSGIGTYIENVVNELLKNHAENEYLFIKEKGVDIGDLGNNSVFETYIKPFSLKELFRFPVSDINKCDVYISPYINIPGGIRIPIYSTIHDVIFLDVPGLTSYLGQMIRKWYIRRAIQKSKKIFTVSKFSKERIKYHFDTNKPIIIANNFISNSLREYTLKHEIRRVKDDYIIFVGNIKKHKGLKVLLEAYDKAITEGFEKFLYIVGNADKFRTADNEIEKWVNNNPKIRFTGYVTNDKLYELISKADALVLPTFYEGYGIPPMEALYLGTDAIVSNIEVLKEVYSDLPVTYFNVGNAEDLKENLLNHHSKITDVEALRKKIDNLYNKVDITNKILSEIENNL